LSKQTKPSVKNRAIPPEQAFIDGYNELMRRTGVKFIGVPYFDPMRDPSGEPTTAFCVRVNFVLGVANMPKDVLRVNLPPRPPVEPPPPKPPEVAPLPVELPKEASLPETKPDSGG